ncbi:monovalent cation/H+ antiporter complex subunit F [Brevibacterium luteolum]|uniref:Sodium:proton antiporter n=1 Tax=Brevibacterium luteolum TaxID=199591 RepID=A0A6G8KY23_9MICO|nr:monovalent cation/H+ antiporter complex subunit F [Brevibacterium luteolum]MBU8579438.1 hypothetical protein [Brevibacterium luteolum]QIN29546.1 hypothetical protein EW640_09870 [Brevibacterium luteolum]
MTIAGYITGLLFSAAVFITIFRMIKGPSILDRMISTDVLLATMLCGFGGFIVVTGRTDLLPVMLVLASLGFVGSVAVSRYVSRSESRTPVIGETRRSAEAHEHALSESHVPGRHQVGPLFASDAEAVAENPPPQAFADGRDGEAIAELHDPAVDVEDTEGKSDDR